MNAIILAATKEKIGTLTEKMPKALINIKVYHCLKCIDKLLDAGFKQMAVTLQPCDNYIICKT